MSMAYKTNHKNTRLLVIKPSAMHISKTVYRNGYFNELT